MVGGRRTGAMEEGLRAVLGRRREEEGRMEEEEVALVRSGSEEP